MAEDRVETCELGVQPSDAMEAVAVAEAVNAAVASSNACCNEPTPPAQRKELEPAVDMEVDPSVEGIMRDL